MGCANTAAFLLQALLSAPRDGSQAPWSWLCPPEMDPKPPGPGWAIPSTVCPRQEPGSGQRRDTGAVVTFPYLSYKYSGHGKAVFGKQDLHIKHLDPIPIPGLPGTEVSLPG